MRNETSSTAGRNLRRRRGWGSSRVQQAEGLGAGVSWLRCQVGKGRLRQLEADVFIVCSSFGGTDVPWQVEALAACLQRGTHARLGFQSAARVWGLQCGGGPEVGRLHVVVPGPTVPRSTQRVSVHRTRRLTAADVATYVELPVTTAARTIVDLAAALPARDVERLVDDALVRGVTTVPLLSGCMGRNSRRGLAGTLALRAAIDLWLDGGVESHAESEVLRFLLAPSRAAAAAAGGDAGARRAPPSCGSCVADPTCGPGDRQFRPPPRAPAALRRPRAPLRAGRARVAGPHDDGGGGAARRRPSPQCAAGVGRDAHRRRY